ncbi:hypothetical protein [Methylorubrum extorquens]|uniref:hypothetical protein n=1 Tax=Methylorubrum extorquens TaxID=408 RepID=UPI0020A05B3D|nr:hypothetical protein [Methylorubrum extorquens]MCP1539973.1 hypothetical protein [Methylorubrum extorquens]
MNVLDTEIPDAVVDALIDWTKTHAFVACQLEAAATRELLRHNITDTNRMVPHRLADRLIQRLRKSGDIVLTRKGRAQVWASPETLH